MCWWQVSDDGDSPMVTDLMHWKNHQHSDSVTNILNQSPSLNQQPNFVTKITVKILRRKLHHGFQKFRTLKGSNNYKIIFFQHVKLISLKHFLGQNLDHVYFFPSSISRKSEGNDIKLYQWWRSIVLLSGFSIPPSSYLESA